MMNELVKTANIPPIDHLSNQSHGKHDPNSPETSSNKFESESKHETDGGEIGGGGGIGRYGGWGARTRNNTESKQRQYNKHSEHDDRMVEDYEEMPSNKSGGDRFKKKCEDRNGTVVKWREEERGLRFGGGDPWENTKNKDRSERNSRSGAIDRNSRFSGERGGRFSEAKRQGGNNEDDKYNDKIGDKYKGSGGNDRFSRYGARGSTRSGEDDEEKSEHSSGGCDRGSERYSSGGRYGSDRGGRSGVDRNNRRSSGDYDGKQDRDRKFDDRGGADKGSGGRFGGGGDRDRFRDKGNTVGRWNDKRSRRDKKDEHSTSATTAIGCTEDSDDWETETPTTKQIACRVTEYPKMDLVVGEEYKVYFSVMGSEPNDVYVQMTDSDILLEDLREQIDLEDVEMSKTSHRNVPKEMLTPGLPVLARFADDQLLYRAIIRSIGTGLVSVLFIDYGNFAQVSAKDLYTVTPTIAEKPAQALRVILPDIKPTSEKWQTELSVYETFYGNDELTLKVNILKCIDGEIVCIGSLTRSDNKTVTQKFIEEGLALSTSSAQPNETVNSTTISIPNIPDRWKGNLDILVGQTFYSTFLKQISKTSMLINITVAKLIIECVCHIPDSEVPVVPDNTNIIVSVQGLEESRLRVFIFDNNGKHFGGNECENITPICPMPIVKTNYLIYISHFDGETIFIQNSTISNELTLLLDQLFERYNSSSGDETVEWKVGMICCVISEDGNWYRAKIISIADDKYLVFYVDYGNKETVRKEQLRQLDSDFFTAELCLGVHLPVEWIVPDPPVMKFVEDEEFNCTIRRAEDGRWVVDLRFVTNDEKLIKKLVDESIAKEIDERVKNKSLVEEVSSAFQLLVGSSLPVVVSHVDSPTMFWVQLCSHLNKIEDVQQKLQDCIKKMPSHCGINEVFAAKYSEDNVWYRAVATGEGDQVRFIDYGNTDPAPIRKELPADLLQPQKGYAIPMYICVQPSSDNWSAEAIKLFEAFIEHQITAEIKSVDEKIIVDLKSSDHCLSKLFVEGNHGKYINGIIPEEEEVTNLVKACIVDFVDVNNFYVQYENQYDKLTEITQTLLEAENFEKVENSKILKGNLLAAKYSIDEQWYRVKICSVNPLKGFFIDYGNISDINECSRLPQNLKMILPLAIHCSMGIENVEGLTEKFASMAMNVTMFNLRIKEEGDPNVVELFNANGELVNDILSKQEVQTVVSKQEVQTVVSKQEVQTAEEKAEEKVPGEIEPGAILINCVVCHANGPYDFYIQTPVSQGLAEDLTEKLTEAVGFPKVDKPEKGDILAVLYPEDNFWYRCKITGTDPEVSGLFIDYGNGTVVDECRSLPEEMKSIPNLALKCSLQLPEGVGGGWSAEAVLTFTEQVNDSVQSFDVEVIAVGEPMVVELIVVDETRSKVTEELRKLCPAATPVTSKPATRATSPTVTTDYYADIPNIIEPSFDKSKTSQIQPQEILNKFSGRCFITHVNSPVDFFVRDSSTSAQLEKVTLALSELEDSPKHLPPYNIGDTVIAQVEGEFFRAKILENDPLKVYLIDIGNTSETSNLLQVPESIKHIPPTAANYALDLPKDHILLTKTGEEEFVFLTTAGNTEFEYEILSERGSVTIIDLSLNNENVIEIIMNNINRKKTLNKTPPDEDNLTVTISYVNSLDSFYIQEITVDFEIVSNSLLNANLFNPNEALIISELVAALNKEDDVWYRAKIINLNPLEVFFVDYGNTSTVDEVRKLPSDIAAIPYFCKLAKLEKPEIITDWSQKDEEEFLNICDTTIEFTCVKVTQNSNTEPIIVKLFSTEHGDISTFLRSKYELSKNILDVEENDNFDAKNSDVTLNNTSEFNTEDKIDEQFVEVQINENVEMKSETLIDQLNYNKNCEDNESTITKDGDEITNTQDFVEKIIEDLNEPNKRTETNNVTEEQIDNEEEDLSTKVSCMDTDENNLNEEQSDDQLPTAISQEILDTKMKSSVESEESVSMMKKVGKPVKSLAEIRANAKSRINTGSASATKLPVANTSSPTTLKSKNSVENKKTSQTGSQMKRSTSYESKIIPGCVGGNIDP